MRVFNLLILIAWMSFSSSDVKHSYWLIDSGEFNVKGKTSIGKFDCKYELQIEDTLFFNQKEGFSYKIPVREFRCGNFILNNDFRKTLKHKEFPEVFFSMMYVDEKSAENSNYPFELYLKIAGKEKHIKSLNLKRNKNVLTGEVELKFNDFDLSPPQKLGGAITVEEDIHLSIRLNIKE